MPVIPRNIRSVRNSVEDVADSLGLELEQDVIGEDLGFDEYFICTSEDGASIPSLRELAQKASEASEELGTRVRFALTFWLLPKELENSVVVPYETVIGQGQLHIECEDDTVDIVYEDGDLDLAQTIEILDLLKDVFSDGDTHLQLFIGLLEPEAA